MHCSLSSYRDGDMLSVWERLFSGALYADNQPLCTLCGPKRSHAFNSAGFNTTIRFSSRSSNFCNFTLRIRQKRSQKVRNPRFSWDGGRGHALSAPSRRHTRALIAYKNSPFQNSRSVIRDGVTFDFYTGLPHICFMTNNEECLSEVHCSVNLINPTLGVFLH